ncbi:hypothetical protein P789_1118 [Enterococcus faecalis MTmid8]|nr:hypothetical protein P789_1118 [Enterococcus faecalis MTmid8]
MFVNQNKRFVIKKNQKLGQAIVVKATVICSAFLLADF